MMRIVFGREYSDGIDLKPEAKKAFEKFKREADRLHEEKRMCRERMQVLDDQFELIKEEHHTEIVKIHPELEDKDFYICDNGHYHIATEGGLQVAEIRQPDWAKELAAQLEKESGEDNG